MNISTEYYYNLLNTLSNLASIKMFQQYGVNVKDYPDYRVNNEFNQDEGSTIIESGLKSLFDSNCEYLNANLFTEDLLTILYELHPEYEPEYAIFIPLEKYKNILHNKPDSFLEKINEVNIRKADYMTVYYLSNRELLVVEIEYLGDYHLILEGILEIYKELELSKNQ